MSGSAAFDAEFPVGDHETEWHSHRRGQLICVDSGLAHIRTPQGSWLLPPRRAGWIPPGEQHWGSMSGVLSAWSVLIAPSACGGLPDRPRVIGVDELMHALVLRAAAWARAERLTPEQARLTTVLLDEICAAPREPLHLPMPRDRRAQKIAKGLLVNPGDTRTLEDWAAFAGLSPRTARRLFLAETGMSFAEWRQQARLVHSLERLAQGDTVGDVADSLGYATASNFIAMFRRAFGETPARYFARRRG
ncbi:AraC family transcriptional regulator [Xaviernesmea oryzae]|uniref:AraC family transcriptional regulator n=1 Tax=Xaviernesmea oryzae TaxID=464029 RepID=UPI000B086587|nr:helix-turn-helix transcriptional regulator [Xaviernesmea oryzae]